MKKLLTIFIISVLSLQISAQENLLQGPERLMNNITLNFLGDGSNISINYERWFRFTDYFFVTAKAGIGYGKKLKLENVVDTILPTPPDYITIPANITLNIGKGRSFGEAGLGSNFGIGNVSPHFIWFLTGGYRLQPLKSGNMSLRIFGNYLISDPDKLKNIFFVPFGISFGIAF